VLDCSPAIADRLRKRVIAIFMQHAFGYAVRPSCLADGGAHYPGGLPGYAEPVSSE
jgi:hypothetical protein